MSTFNTTAAAATTPAKKNYDLRGANNWETAWNTANAIIGLTSTGVMTSAHLVANGTELVLTHAVPEAVATAIVETAKSEGVMSTWDSLMAEKSTRAATDYIYAQKDKWMGKGDRKAEKTLMETLNQLPTITRLMAVELVNVAKNAGATATEMVELLATMSMEEAMAKLGEKYAEVGEYIAKVKAESEA